MKKYILLLSAIIALASCSKFDDSEIWSKLNDYETRISKLEANQEAMSKVVEAMKSWDYITNISPIKDGDVTIGYELTFSKLGKISIFNGIDGKDGDSMFKDVTYDDIFVTMTLADGTDIRIERFQGIQLWEDGPYWAPFNIGSTKPEEPGLYFSWANVTGYAPIDGKFTYMFSDPDVYSSEPGAKLYTDIPENALYDAAKSCWGGKWRMPTGDELRTLVNDGGENKTDGGKWVKDYYGTGVNGVLFTGTGDYSEKSVFFPATGWGNYQLLSGYNEVGFYWSTTCGGPNMSLSMGIDKSVIDVDFDYRSIGFSIRPVFGK